MEKGHSMMKRPLPAGKAGNGLAVTLGILLGVIAVIFRLLFLNITHISFVVEPVHGLPAAALFISASVLRDLCLCLS